MSAQLRQKARDLIELALDESTTDEERISAAMKAAKLIRKHDLLSSPLDGLLDSDNETVQAASNIFEVLTDPKLAKSVKKVADQFRRRR
jgi:hypothetical protein